MAVKGLGSIEYTAGPNIDISDYIISGRDWTSDIDSAIEGVKGSGFSAATAWVDSQGYLTAHQDVDNLPYVQNSALEFYGVNISGISGSGLYALSAEGSMLKPQTLHIILKVPNQQVMPKVPELLILQIMH